MVYAAQQLTDHCGGAGALRAGFERLREVLNTSASGFHHELHDRSVFDDTKEERWEFFERLWNSPASAKLTSNYRDVMLDRDANAEWCEFIAEKIRSIVDDPETAEKLIRRTICSARSGRRSSPATTRRSTAERVPRRPRGDADRCASRRRHRDHRR
jgi:hypothetical protein